MTNSAKERTITEIKPSHVVFFYVLAAILLLLTIVALSVLSSKTQQDIVEEELALRVTTISLANLPVTKKPVPKPAVKPKAKPKPEQKLPAKPQPKTPELPKPVAPQIEQPKNIAPELVPAPVVFEETATTESVSTETAPAEDTVPEGLSDSAEVQVDQQQLTKAAQQAAEKAYYPRLGSYLKAFVLREYKKVEARGHSALGETITIEYTIDKQGNLLDYKLLRRPKSNHVARAIKRGIKAAAPFPEIPDAMSLDTLTQTQTIRITPPSNSSE